MNESESVVAVNDDDYDWWEENCAIIPPEQSRLLLVGVAGAIVASVSVVFNMFLFCVLVRNKRYRSSSLIYLTFLALADTFLSVLGDVCLIDSKIKKPLKQLRLVKESADEIWACIYKYNSWKKSTHWIFTVECAIISFLGFLSPQGVFIQQKYPAYILLFPVNIYMDYFASDFLASAWWTYMRIIITTSHVFISASAFLIVAAAFERYMTISKIRNQFARHHRLVICSMALVFAMIAKLPMYFEVEVVPNGNCTGITALTAKVSEFSETEPYKTAYKYWFRSIITIILPFALCFYFNIGIIRRLRVQHQGAKLFRFATSDHRKNIRSATLMLVFVTCTYLASNMLNVIVYTWELIDKPSLMSEQLRPFYTLSSDLVSLLTVLASACRLPIYIACNVRIRCEVLDALGNCVLFQTAKNDKALSPKLQRHRSKTVRYCETGCGFMIYEDNDVELPPVKPTKSGQVRGRSIGTGLDKVVLSVAMNNRSLTVPSFADSEELLED